MRYVYYHYYYIIPAVSYDVMIKGNGFVDFVIHMFFFFQSNQSNRLINIIKMITYMGRLMIDLVSIFSYAFSENLKSR